MAGTKHWTTGRVKDLVTGKYILVYNNTEEQVFQEGTDYPFPLETYPDEKNSADCVVIYSNIELSQDFTRNNCGEDAVGTSVTYTVPAGKYTSSTSQSAANALAQSDIDINGQNYANSNGTCIPNGTIPVADFDYLVPQYTWTTANGRDLDTFTAIIDSGTTYDGQNVGYGTIQSSYVPTTSTSISTSYLAWASDNTGANGPETVLFNLKKFIDENPTAPNLIKLRLNAVWYGRRGQDPVNPSNPSGTYSNMGAGDMVIGFKAYKGGIMSVDSVNYNYINTGGIEVANISLGFNVPTYNQLANVSNSTPVAILTYNKTTSSATIVLQ